MKIKSEFTVASWEQADLDGLFNGQPMMRVSAVFEPSGEIQGRFLVAYLMYCRLNDGENPHDAQARYTGYMVFDGEINGKTGSFAMEDTGIYADSAPSSSLRIVDCSGTGDFEGIAGAGKYYADGNKMIIEIDYILKAAI